MTDHNGVRLIFRWVRDDRTFRIVLRKRASIARSKQRSDNAIIEMCRFLCFDHHAQSGATKRMEKMRAAITFIEDGYKHPWHGVAKPLSQMVGGFNVPAMATALRCENASDIFSYAISAHMKMRQLGDFSFPINGETENIRDLQKAMSGIDFIPDLRAAIDGKDHVFIMGDPLQVAWLMKVLGQRECHYDHSTASTLFGVPLTISHRYNPHGRMMDFVHWLDRTRPAGAPGREVFANV